MMMICSQRVCQRSALNRCRGSALVESAALLVVMVPVLFGVVMVGKLIDLKQTTEQASRYAAWEATVYSRTAPAGAEPFALKERFFGDPSNSLQSVASEPGTNSLWGAHTGHQPGSLWARSAIQIDEHKAISQPYERGVGTPEIAMQVGRQIGRSGEILENVGNNEWHLETDGLVRAAITVDVEHNGWLPGDGQHCGTQGAAGCVQSSSVILTDGWSSSGDAQAARRVKSLVPASALASVGKAVSLVGAIPVFKELKKLDGAFGHVDMNVLPAYAMPKAGSR